MTPMITTIPRVRQVDHVSGLTVRLWFTDGLTGEVDLGYLLDRGPIFQPLRQPGYFRTVRVDPILGTVVWPNGADVAPETLHEIVRGSHVAG